MMRSALKEFYASDKSFHYTYQYDLNSNLIAVNDLNNRQSTAVLR